MSQSRQKNGQQERACLADEAKQAIGLEVMVTVNIETESDVANGVRGVVEDILFDSRETISGQMQEGELERLPVCILVKLDWAKAKKLPSLEQGIISILPMRQKYQIPGMTKPAKSVTRRQFPIKSAYAFIDYRAPGQTIERVTVNIVRLPRGQIDEFNAYVALSRSRRKETILLLQDFDSALFTTIPSVHLEEEDKRLYGLDKATAACS